MNLDFGSQYDNFRNEVKSFCDNYRGVTVKRSVLGSLLYTQEESTTAAKEDDLVLTAQEWQKILIENGYFARNIPKEYGGFGAKLDIVENVIINQEFSKAKIPLGTGGQGIDFLVPTLLEMGTEEQKKRYIRPALYLEEIWCQGYSEPNAGSDLASLQTKGVLEGDEWVINGQKIWTSTAKYAQMMFCLLPANPALCCQQY